MPPRTAEFESLLSAIASDELVLAQISGNKDVEATLQALAAEHSVHLTNALSDVVAVLGRLGEPFPAHLLALKHAVQVRKDIRAALSATTRRLKAQVLASFGLCREPVPTAKAWASANQALILTWDGVPVITAPPRTVLLDEECLGFAGAAARSACLLPATSGSGITVLPVDRSLAVFGPDGSVHLLVVRNASGTSSLADLVKVVDEAVMDRNNVRPTHPGKMIQFGQNAGQRNVWVNGCRVFGDVRNFTRINKFSDEEVEAKNRRILGLISILWNMACVAVPSEVMDVLHDEIAVAGLPPMSAPGDRRTKGYTVTIDGKEHTFAAGRRPPCEAYMSLNYTAPIHLDKTWATYTLTWNIGRAIRSTSEASGGGHFVDCGAGVKVVSAPDTLIVFQANHPHGTTQSWNVNQHYVTQTFSERIKQAFEHAQAAAVQCFPEVRPADDLPDESASA